MSGITVAYSGVHQIFQIALAASELGKLDRFYCSICDGSGSLITRLASATTPDALINRRSRSIDPTAISEFPWPFFLNRISKKLSTHEWPLDWQHANYWFDRHVSQRLTDSSSKLFVGVETCARDSLRTAKSKGMTTVLDSPQAHPAFLHEVLSVAARDLNLPRPGPIDDPKMAARKEEEIELADFILIFSDVQKHSFLEAGLDPAKLVQIPLWADPALWFPPPRPRPATDGPLQVLFVGQISMRKGVPYLLEAIGRCREPVALTLIGLVAQDAQASLHQYQGRFTLRAPLSKAGLRELMWRSDLVVLPSLLDTFGFAAMEAMACGLPVVVSENCGVPVPDPTWIVPIMNPSALAERIDLYAGDRDLCREHGQRALGFAAHFTPERYRAELKKLFTSLLGEPG
ncbi:MAG TPA: glycosyltransferase family 4 protein [Chthoniobacterales bacterium]|nr:glycosyltransferase family 4 protein [Chthoniobacterales bacterium]